MAKILIVDDEKLTRTDILYKVSRSGYPFEWIMEAASGEEALELLHDHPPDILLTDIVMNEMNGIELIRRGQEICPNMVSVIICGYAEFSFAQEAVRLHVVDYLLKPIRQEQLSAVLSRAMYALGQKKEYESLSARSDMLRRQISDRELWEKLHIFLNSADAPGLEFDARTLFPNDAACFMICILRASLDARGTAGGFGPGDDSLLRYGISNIVLEMGEGYFLPFGSFGERHQLIIIAASPMGDGDAARGRMLSLARRMLNTAFQALGVRADLGASTTDARLTAVQMTQAKQALDLRLYSDPDGRCRCFYYGDCFGPARDFPEEEFRLYRRLIIEGDQAGAQETARRILDSPAAPSIRMAYVEMVCVLVRACARKGVSIYSYLGSECVSGAVIDRFETKRDVVESLCNTIAQALGRWVCAKDTAAVLQNVKSYIEEHFCENELCTNSLSSRFSISLGYLSATYRKVFGIPISKYIISLRMEYAGKLLRETGCSLQTICEQTGFNNMSYFLRVFKRTYQCTPTEYREGMRLPEQAATL